MPDRAVTLRDVAILAGVAPSTVSRVLTQPDRINIRTRERVLAAAREVGYQPPGLRRQGGRLGLVALVVPDLSSPFFLEVIRGAQGRLQAAGYHQVLIYTEESAEIERAALAQLNDTLAGALLAASRLTEEALQEVAGRLPLVALNRAAPGVSSIIVDSAAGVEQAVDHLASLGHRRICYVSGPTGSWANEERWRGCVAAGHRLGVEILSIGPFPPYIQTGAAAADALVNTRATAAIAFNDMLALGMLSRLQERGIAVPGDVSLVGHDGIFGTEFCSPPLTTLTVPIFQAAAAATSLLLTRIEQGTGGVAQVNPLPATLTIRGSTGPCRSG